METRFTEDDLKTKPGSVAMGSDEGPLVRNLASGVAAFGPQLRRSVPGWALLGVEVILWGKYNLNVKGGEQWNAIVVADSQTNG